MKLEAAQIALPGVAPAGAFSVLGQPDEDAWNRHVAAFVADRRRAAAAEYRDAQANTRAMLLASGEFLVTDGTRRGLVDELGQDGAELAIRGIAEREAEHVLERFRNRRHALELEALARAKATSATGEALISTARRSAKACQPRNVLTRCGCGSRLVDGGCNRTDCVRCAPTVTARRARAVVAKLEGAIDAAIVRLKQRSGRTLPRSRFALRVAVCTVPLELRERLASKVAHNRFRRNLIAVFRRNLGAGFAMVATHPVGDVDPTLFHPHFNVLWMPAGLAPWATPAPVLDALKRAWAYLLEHDGHLPRQSREWRRLDAERRRAGREGLPFVFPDGPPLVVDVHGEFAKGDQPKQLRHHARYYARVFVGWGFWLPKAVQWFGAYPRGLVPLVICPCCGERFTIDAVGANAAELYKRRRETAAQRPQGPPAPGRPSTIPLALTFPAASSSSSRPGAPALVGMSII